MTGTWSQSRPLNEKARKHQECIGIERARRRPNKLPGNLSRIIEIYALI